MSDSQQQDNVRDLLDACRLQASGPRRVIVEIDMTTNARLIDIIDVIKPLGQYHSAKVRLNQDQPCQKTNVNAGTAQVMTTTHFAAETSGSPIVESAPTADASRTTPPSEPEVMKALRSTLKQSLGFQLLWYEVTEIVTHIDTLSARLKRAEELLRRAVPFLADNGHMERTIDAFLAGKGEA